MLLEYIKHIKQQWLMQTVVFTLGQQLLLLEFLYNILVLCALEKKCCHCYLCMVLGGDSM